jgi:DHA1 family inner membrane transport protein
VDRRLLVLALGMFSIGTDSFVVAGILPAVAHSLHTSVPVSGQMVTVFALSYALLSPIVATAAANWPRKRLLLGGIGIFIVANVMTAVAPSLNLVLASRVLAGLGAATFSPTATATGASLVPAAQRGRALAVVIAGLSSATALGAPIGTALAGFADWRITMWFVAALGVASGIGVWGLLPEIPPLPAVGLRQRLEPLGDSRVALTLLTTLVAYTGLFVVYTYVGVSFNRATGGDETVLAGLLFLWGIAATIGNLGAGRLTDRVNGRLVINVAITVAAIDFALLPWTTASLPSAIVAIIIWGLCGWGLLAPQQHRLINIAPGMAPLLMGLNSAAVYIGVSASGVIGAAGLTFLNQYSLGVIGACFLATSLVLAESAHRSITRRIAGSSSKTGVDAEQSRFFQYRSEGESREELV